MGIVTTALPNLDVLREILARDDGTITAHEQGELRAALRLLNNISYTPAPKEGTPCTICGLEVILPAQALVPVFCAECVFWLNTIGYVANLELGADIPYGSVRAGGYHYTFDTEALDGPPTTIRLLSGKTLVTTRLRTQGQIPERWRQHLPDNAIVQAGDGGRAPGVYH